MPDQSRILIVGCGYVGKRLAGRLLAQQVSVSGIVHSEASLLDCQQHHIACEQLDLDKAQDERDLTGMRAIYLAPPPRSGRKDTRITKFLDAIKKHPPDKFVLISTTGVYGDCQGAWIDESTPLNPTADRAWRREDSEKQARLYCDLHDVPLVILRVAGIYGPGKLPVARIKSGQPIVTEEDSPFTNRIHADDLVTICERALMDTNIVGTYNVTDGHPGTMYEYFNGVAAAFGLPAPPAISLQEAQDQLSEGMLSYMAESRRISNDALLNDFNLQLQHPTLTQGLQHCVETHEDKL